MQRRIGSPGFDSLQIEIAILLENALENQIGARKSVGITDGAQADIFRRPRAEAFGLPQCLAKRQRVLRFGEQYLAAQHAP